jgi:hypothetical protein
VAERAVDRDTGALLRATVIAMTGRPGTRAALCTAVLAAAVATASRTGVGPELVLWLTPLLVLIVPLIAGRFPGEAALQAYRRARTSVPRRRDARSVATRRRTPRAAGHCGRLLAFSLAERGPPAAAALAG